MFVRKEPARSKKSWDIRRCRKYVPQLTNHQSVGSFINPAWAGHTASAQEVYRSEGLDLPAGQGNEARIDTETTFAVISLSESRQGLGIAKNGWAVNTDVPCFDLKRQAPTDSTPRRMHGVE